MLKFLKPLCDTLNKIERDGGFFQYDGAPEPFICKVLTISGTCDLLAKAIVLNAVQFNGHFGCLKCERSERSPLYPQEVHV